MFCKNCGKQIDDDSKFCQFCGKTVIKVEKKILVHNTEDDTVLKSTELTKQNIDPLVAKYVAQEKQKLVTETKSNNSFQYVNESNCVKVTSNLKKRRNIIIALILTLLTVCVGISAVVYILVDKGGEISKKIVVNGIIYSFDSMDKSYYVSGVENKEITVANIESKINSYPVTVIGSAEPGLLVEGPFRFCKNLTNVAIPNTVKIIGYDSFQGCSALKSIVIPNSVTEIRYNSFEYCTSLTKIVLPNSVKKIGKSAFIHCASLKEIKLPDSITSLDEMVFWGCKELTSLRIPKNITYIPEYFTFDCKNLANIYIPKSVKTVGKGAIGFNSSRVVANFHYQGTKEEWANVSIQQDNNQMNYVDNFIFSSYPKLS